MGGQMSGDHNQYQKERSYLDDRREDIIEMAREAGLPSAMILHLYEGNERALCDSEIEELERIMKFAELVAAAERKRALGITKTMQKELQDKFKQTYMKGAIAGAAAEREACAEIAFKMSHSDEEAFDVDAAIRARGQA